MGITGSKIYVALDQPAVDVKLYRSDVERIVGGPLRVASGEIALENSAGRVVLRVGDPLDLVVSRRDARRDRWILEPVGLAP